MCVNALASVVLCFCLSWHEGTHRYVLGCWCDGQGLMLGRQHLQHRHRVLRAYFAAAAQKPPSSKLPLHLRICELRVCNHPWYLGVDACKALKRFGSTLRLAAVPAELPS